MGNRTSRSFDYERFTRLIEEGPNYLLSDQSVWTQSEKRCLKDFLSFFKEKGLPWANADHEAFVRVKLAVPKSKMAAEIHSYVENPIEKDLDAFGSLQPRAQAAWAHFYSLVLFMWSLQQGRPSALTFYESDLLYYVFRNGYDVDYERIDLFIRALEKIQVVSATQPVQNLVKNRVLFGPFTLISGVIKSGSIMIRAEQEPRLIEPGVYSMDGPVVISGFEIVPNIKRTVYDESEMEPSLEKSGRHFLNRQREDTSSEEESSSSLMIYDHEHCGPKHVKEYLDEILFRVDVLCRFHKKLGFK